MHTKVVGAAVGIALSIGLGAAMVPLRSGLSIATAGLVLVVPVVAGVVVGGFWAGIATVVTGFLVYDLVFIPPYFRLTVGSGQNWAALGVYAVVMVLTARVVAALDAARSDAERRTSEAGRLSELSELLVADRSVADLLESIVRAVWSMFAVPGATLLVPEGDGLAVAASAGEGLTPTELDRIGPHSGVPVSLATAAGAVDGIHAVALTASDRPVGMLVLRGMPASVEDRGLLRTFANHAALALERTRLRERAMRSELLEEMDRLRHALVGAVSHDLRTPLASMKVASSTLLDPNSNLSEDDVGELHALIDVETDRLTRLVTSLLDMTRIDSGAFEVRRVPTSVLELVTGVVASVRPALGERGAKIAVSGDVPDVDVDPLLIGQVLANLLDNAGRHAPAGSVVTVESRRDGDRITVSVSDLGPGVPCSERETVFDRFVRFDTGGRAGLGLTIAKTFVEAHGERIWVEDAPGGGARFVFTLTPASVLDLAG